jgi:hypothetical protein
MMGKLETTRKLMKSNQFLGIYEPCLITNYAPLPFYAMIYLKIVYVKMEGGGETQKPILVQSTDRYLNPHFLKFKAGMLTTIL